MYPSDFGILFVYSPFPLRFLFPTPWSAGVELNAQNLTATGLFFGVKPGLRRTQAMSGTKKIRMEDHLWQV